MFFGEGSDFNSELGKPEIRTIGRARFGSSYQRNQKENANRSVNLDEINYIAQWDSNKCLKRREGKIVDTPISIFFLIPLI